MRVSSLDGSLLDLELHSLLFSPLQSALKFFHPTFTSNYDPELVALLRLALWKVGIWDNNTSYGSLIQNLQYRTIINGTPLPPTKRQKLVYGVLTVLLPYALSKTEAWLTLSNDLSPAQWKDRLQRFITASETLLSTLSLVNFLAFLVNGRYRSLPDRLLKLRLVPLTKSQHHHLLSYEYLNRQLTWTSLTEFLLFILPLILPSYRRLRRRIVRSTNLSTSADGKGELSNLPERFCAICFAKGREGRLVTNPYCGECGHVYCYACLMESVAEEEGDGWSCLRCGTVVKKIKRWEETVGDDAPAVEVTEEKLDAPAEEVVPEEEAESPPEEIQEEDEEEEQDEDDEDEEGIRIL